MKTVRRKKIFGTTDRPRLSVFRSEKYIYGQLIDDTKSITIVYCSDLKLDKGNKIDRAYKIGENLAKIALKKNIKKIVFDRGVFKYHGRIKAVAEGARKGGLEF